MRAADRHLRVGIITDGLEERRQNGQVTIANGGVGVYIYNLVTHLRIVAPHCESVLIRYGSADLDIYRREGQQTVALGSSLPVRAARALDVPYGRLARELRLDLLHYPNQFGGAFLSRSVRRVVTLHDITPLLFPDYHLRRSVLGYRFLLRRALRSADHVIVDSASTQRDIVERGLVAADRTTVVPLGVAERFRPGIGTPEFARRYNLPPRYLLSVGVLEPRKNHRALLAALARLHGRGDPIGLVIVGRDGWGWRNPLDDPAFAHLRSAVRVLRNVPDADLPELYCRAAALAYPSLYEGFGLPIVEAMACGTPVVTSRVSSLPEVAGNAALFVDPENPDDLAEKLATVLSDNAVRQRLVTAGLQRANELSWQGTAEQTCAVYERVASRL